MKRKYLYILFLLPLLLACKPKAPTHVVDAGTADFTKFIAIGDGHTAGYICLLYTSPSPRDRQKSRMPSSA